MFKFPWLGNGFDNAVYYYTDKHNHWATVFPWQWLYQHLRLGAIDVWSRWNQRVHSNQHDSRHQQSFSFSAINSNQYARYVSLTVCSIYWWFSELGSTVNRDLQGGSMTQEMPSDPELQNDLNNKATTAVNSKVWCSLINLNSATKHN